MLLLSLQAKFQKKVRKCVGTSYWVDQPGTILSINAITVLELLESSPLTHRPPNHTTLLAMPIISLTQSPYLINWLSCLITSMASLSIFLTVSSSCYISVWMCQMYSRTCKAKMLVLQVFPRKTSRQRRVAIWVNLGLGRACYISYLGTPAYRLNLPISYDRLLPSILTNLRIILAVFLLSSFIQSILDFLKLSLTWSSLS